MQHLLCSSRARCLASTLGAVLALVACGDDDGGGDGGGGTGTGGASATTTAGDGGGASSASSASSSSTASSSPTGGPTTAGGSTATGATTGGGAGDPAFQSAFSADGYGTSCDTSRAALVDGGAPYVEIGGVTLVAGFSQVSGNNQDPVFFRFDGDALTYCLRHEDDSPDGRAHGLTWDGGPTAYVVYAVTGGGTDFDALAQGGWVTSYGDGGGSSSVMVVASVDVASGAVTHATFVPAKRDGGTKTNTLRPAGAPRVLDGGTVEVTGFSAFAPLNPDRSVMCVPDAEYPAAFDGAEGPSYLARLSPDFATMQCASTAGCSLVTTPCP